MIKINKKTRTNKINLFSQTLNMNNFVLNIKILNRQINKKYIKAFYKFLKTYKYFLFNRRIYLFMDFLKINSLFIEEKVNTLTYIKILGLIFKNLIKKSHNKYFLFIKELFNNLTDFFRIKIKEKTRKLLNLKLEIKGRLRGRLRAKKLTIMPIRPIKKTPVVKNNLNKINIRTIYGIYGLCLFIQQEN